MPACYIIYSKQIDKFYIGATQEDVYSRLDKHNSNSYGKKFTSQTSDWVLFHFIEFGSYAQAINIERHIKKMKTRKYLEDLIKYPEISTKLLAKYKTT